MSFTSLTTAWPEGDGDPVGEMCAAEPFDGSHVLAPIIEPEERAVADQLSVATTLARSTDASLLVADARTRAASRRYEHRDDIEAGDEDELVEWALDAIDVDAATAGNGVRSGRSLAKHVLRTIANHDIDTVVVPDDRSGNGLRRTVTEQITTHADCDVVVVSGRPGHGDVASILLPVAGGPHSGLATDIARSVAEDHGAWIDLLYVVEPDPSARERLAAERCLANAREHLDGFADCDTWMLEADDVAEAIIEQSEYYPLTVLGAPTKGRLRRFVFGSTSEDVRAEARSSILVGRSRGNDAVPEE